MKPPHHPTLPPRRPAAILVNLGTPAAPTAPAVRRYLAEFLSDRRVVDYPRALWLPLLHGVILNVRPARSARNYAKIWTDEGSPLMIHTRDAAAALQARFGEALVVDWAMRYGERSVGERIEALFRAGCDRIMIAPMYPQYAQSTVASVADAAFAQLRRMNWQPALRVAAPFYDAPVYIDALRRRLAASLEAEGIAPERVLLSFHGAPQRQLAAGDPYYCQCAKTARLVREAMGWSEEFAPLTFQSRFGREPWHGPATDDTLRDLAAKGVRRVAVATPGFMADCIETLEEIAIGAAELFHEAGGERLHAIPCLNASPPAIDLLYSVIRAEAAGWISERT